MDKQEKSTSRTGSSQRGEPAEKKSDQHPTQSDGVARSNPNNKSDERVKREGKKPFISLHRDRSPSRSRRPSNIPRSDKSLSQTRGDFYRPSSSHCSDPRDLGPKSRVCNAPHGTDSELTDGQSSSPRRLARAIKRYVEGIPKSKEIRHRQVSKFYCIRRVSILSLTSKRKPTGHGVIKNPDNVGGKSITEYRLDGLDSRLIQVENYLEMIATTCRLCDDLASQDKHGITGFSLGHLHMGGFVPSPYGGTSAGGQSVNGGTYEGEHRPYMGA